MIRLKYCHFPLIGLLVGLQFGPDVGQFTRFVNGQSLIDIWYIRANNDHIVESGDVVAYTETNLPLLQSRILIIHHFAVIYPDGEIIFLRF